MALVRTYILLVVGIIITSCDYGDESVKSFNVTSSRETISEVLDVAIIEVSLSEALNQDFQFVVSNPEGNNEDYLIEDTVTIPAGYVSKSFALQTIDNNTFDGNRSFTLEITPVNTSLLTTNEPEFLDFTVVDDEVLLSITTNAKSPIKVVLKRSLNDLIKYPLDTTSIIDNGHLLIPGSLTSGSLELYFYSETAISNLNYSLDFEGASTAKHIDSSIAISEAIETGAYSFFKDDSEFIFQ